MKESGEACSNPACVVSHSALLLLELLLAGRLHWWCIVGTQNTFLHHNILCTPLLSPVPSPDYWSFALFEFSWLCELAKTFYRGISICELFSFTSSAWAIHNVPSSLGPLEVIENRDKIYSSTSLNILDTSTLSICVRQPYSPLYCPNATHYHF